MAFPKAQNPLDWLTQCWHICLGRKVNADTDDWLVGPVGAVGETAGEFVERLAADQHLTISRNTPGSGLLTRIDNMGLSIDPHVADFYHHTIDYTFEARFLWEPRFGILARIVSKLFSRRVKQFNLPHMTASFKSEIIQLIDGDERVVYTVWIRSMRETGEVAFYGVYSTCQLPSGAHRVKAVFSLPQGDVTVIFALRLGSRGELQLVSSGKEESDTGCFVFVEDRRGGLWKRNLRGVRQQISVMSSGTSEVAADHSITFWVFKAYHVNYTIQKMNRQDEE